MLLFNSETVLIIFLLNSFSNLHKIEKNFLVIIILLFNLKTFIFIREFSLKFWVIIVYLLDIPNLNTK